MIVFIIFAAVLIYFKMWLTLSILVLIYFNYRDWCTKEAKDQAAADASNARYDATVQEERDRQQ
jgi:hypothetical protein